MDGALIGDGPAPGVAADSMRSGMPIMRILTNDLEVLKEVEGCNVLSVVQKAKKIS